MNTFLFLLFHNTTRFWNTLTYFTVNLSVEYSRLTKNLQGAVSAEEVIDVSSDTTDNKEKEIRQISIPLSPMGFDHA